MPVIQYLRTKLIMKALGIALFCSMPFLAADGPVTGRAVFYSDKMHGHQVAMKGEKYDKAAMTAATHSQFPLGSTVKVTNLGNKKSVVVKVNDRMNKRSKSLIDLSRKAAEELDFIRAGHAKVTVELVETHTPASAKK